jgi:hypothetical protein
MMKGTFRAYGLLLAGGFLAGCSGVHVDSSGDLRREDTPGLTYAWAAEAPELDPEESRQLRDELAADLAARGITEAEASQPDLLVSSSVDVSTRMRANDPSTYYSNRFPLIEQIEEGALTLAFTDVRTGELRWEGTGRRELRTVEHSANAAASRFVPTGEQRNWDVPETVREILKQFPAPR